MGFFKLGKLDRDREKQDKAPRGGEVRGGDARGGDARSVDGRGGDARAGDDRRLSGAGSTTSPREDARALGSGGARKKMKDPEAFNHGVADGVARSSASNGNNSGGGGSCGGQPKVQANVSVNDFIFKTKMQQRQGLKPSGPELIAYARYLGIDPVADHDLLWIAVEALEAPLPSDWTEHFDTNDRVFYYNTSSRVSSWTHPLEQTYRETYKTIVSFRNSNTASQERVEKFHQLQRDVQQMEQDVHKEIAQWTEHFDEQGNRFYFNREERQSTWTDPRPAKCQILYLHMKMLRLLQSSAGMSHGFVEPKGYSQDYDDPALKRPKVGASKMMEGSAAGVDDGTESVVPECDVQPSAESCNSDSDSDEGSRKKKKKKKKKKKRDERHRPAPNVSDSAGAPPQSGTQNLKTSQSEPIVGGVKPLLGNGADDSRNTAEGRNSTHIQPSPSGPNSSVSMASFEASEGLTSVGRVRVKAGIRLDPLTSTSSAAPSALLGSADRDHQGNGLGVRSSASVPTL